MNNLENRSVSAFQAITAARPYIDSEKSTAVLLVNLGTPDSPTFLGVMSFLRKFLWDRRVVEYPRLLWWLILHLCVLPFRTLKAVKLYRQIWLMEGSPLRVYTERLAHRLNLHFHEKLTQSNDNAAQKISIFYAMTYGNPSIETVLNALEEKKFSRLIVLPLFPQYSGTTTAAVFDKVVNRLKTQRYIPSLHFINNYSEEDTYVQALADSLTRLWQAEGPTERLLFSFHGLPLKNIILGDPYQEQCQRLAVRVAETLKIPEKTWNFSFQSRVGRGRWLMPDTTSLLVQWAREGVKSVTVISPSFAVDCLETLEELNIRNRNYFLNAGGQCYHYARALNDTSTHVSVLATIIEKFF